MAWHMVPEGTPGEWSLLATHPKHFGARAELHGIYAAANELGVGDSFLSQSASLRGAYHF